MMGAKAPAVVVFADKELQAFYRAYASGLESAKVMDCHEGPAWASRGRAELVVIDFGFRPSQGLDLLKVIKKSAPSTVVVMVAERSSEETVIEAFHAGARRYLRKPVGMIRLRGVTRSLLKLSRTAAESRVPFAEDGPGRSAPGGGVRTGKPANLLKAVHFMEENLGLPIDLETCAKEASLSKFQFCRAFKRYFGTPPIKYLTSLRIGRARDLLAHDDLNITEVAMSVGFPDQGSFTKAFKRQTGLLPSRFRHSIRDALRA
jgi:AraC-like DNA-binding protein/ActR/RegA family two-component response regulator